MKDTFRYFISETVGNVVGLVLILFALAVLFISILFDNADVAAWMP
ncbi:MAG: hypothetical protein IPM59_15380 [Chloracidobacterium sp.]|nr:hypothetical protein [Chloracidobacterium sp.]